MDDLADYQSDDEPSDRKPSKLDPVIEEEEMEETQFYKSKGKISKAIQKEPFKVDNQCQ